MAASHDDFGPAEWLADVIGYFSLVIEATTRSVLIGPTVEHGPERAKKKSHHGNRATEETKSTSNSTL